MSGFSRIDPRQIVRWTIGPAMIIEIGCVIMQSARGVTSHFNHATPFDDAIFALERPLMRLVDFFKGAAQGYGT